MGRLAARVVDEHSQPVRGVAADLFKVTQSGLVYWRASRTSGNGTAAFGSKDGVIAGDYIVRIQLMPWQKLGAGESNDHPVKLTAGDDVVVTFRIASRHPGAATLTPTP